MERPSKSIKFGVQVPKIIFIVVDKIYYILFYMLAFWMILTVDFRKLTPFVNPIIHLWATTTIEGGQLRSCGFLNPLLNLPRVSYFAKKPL